VRLWVIESGPRERARPWRILFPGTWEEALMQAWVMATQHSHPRPKVRLSRPEDIWGDE
jgi:hypothetical protein